MKINSVKVEFLIDTNSAVSILSSNIFRSLENAPTHSWRGGGVFNTLTAADCGIIKTYGKSLISFQLGDIDFTQEFIIADIDDLQGISGFDFLENNDIAVHVAIHILNLDKFVEFLK